MSRNPVHHKRTKHIEFDIHFVREKVAVGEVRVLHVPSARQLADVFTKGLPSSLFFDLPRRPLRQQYRRPSGGGGGVLRINHSAPWPSRHDALRTGRVDDVVARATTQRPRRETRLLRLRHALPQLARICSCLYSIYVNTYRCMQLSFDPISFYRGCASSSRPLILRRREHGLLGLHGHELVVDCKWSGGKTFCPSTHTIFVLSSLRDD
jgi:hypothetical protein